MTVITMPKLTDAMEEGTILTWLKRDGDNVEAGEDLLEIETDKATVTHPAEASGILSVIASEGTTLAVGEPIASVGEKAPASADDAQAASIGAAPEVTESEDAGEPESDLPTTPPAVSNGHGVIAGDDREVKATPIARRVARAHGVPLEQVAGTGPLGRVTRRDVLAKAGLSPTPRQKPSTAERAPAAERAPTAADAAKGNVEAVELTRVQSTIARRMADANATIPEFQVETEVEMDEMISFRGQLEEIGDSVPSLNNLIVKAAALALRRHPRVNGSYRDGRFELYSRVNIGIAVAAGESLI
ncbi:MAG: 2-oxo acid dehydrogenase subunit E2, partial [Solirubrobacterales bacterium]|nr:2-oxo acid dehydrogenase subunit E2 [Solirubrobacterales bacterium]